MNLSKKSMVVYLLIIVVAIIAGIIATKNYEKRKTEVDKNAEAFVFDMLQDQTEEGESSEAEEELPESSEVEQGEDFLDIDVHDEDIVIVNNITVDGLEQSIFDITEEQYCTLVGELVDEFGLRDAIDENQTVAIFDSSNREEAIVFVDKDIIMFLTEVTEGNFIGRYGDKTSSMHVIK